MRSEIFSQGTLMLRVVIQVSMLLAIPLMAFFLYAFPDLAPWYISYVILFNMLVGPGVFRRQRDQRARTRNARPAADHDSFAGPDSVGQAGLGAARLERADDVLAVAAVVGRGDGQHLLEQSAAPCWPIWLIVLTVCLTTATIALFCSVMFRKTSISLMTTYLVIVVLFTLPLGGDVLCRHVLSRHDGGGHRSARRALRSPFAAAFNLPIDTQMPRVKAAPPNWIVFRLVHRFLCGPRRRRASHHGLAVQRPLADGMSRRGVTATLVATS